MPSIAILASAYPDLAEASGTKYARAIEKGPKSCPIIVHTVEFPPRNVATFHATPPQTIQKTTNK
jgi:hypothetical protein